MQNDDTENLRSSDCSSAVIVGVNDQADWNAQISEMQLGLEFELLVEFLERLKEPFYG